MLCSASTLRSSVNWMDRLRSTRGIPTSDAEDLDHFLLGNPPTEANPNPDPTSVSPPVPAAVVSRPQSLGVREIVTSILSDLFDMGGTVREPVLEAGRSSRKQPNPRFLPCFQDGVRASSLDSRWDERGKEGLEENAGVDDVGEEEERGVGNVMQQVAEDDDDGLIGYSRSEVTIIDTSCEVWKFEKVVYRRKDVWKVRERKCKGRGKLRKIKKKKLGGSEIDVRGGGGKRRAVEFLNEGPNSMEKDKRSLENEMTVVGNIEAGASFSDSVARKRDSGSSVALIKVMPVKIKKAKLRTAGIYLSAAALLSLVLLLFPARSIIHLLRQQ